MLPQGFRFTEPVAGQGHPEGGSARIFRSKIHQGIVPTLNRAIGESYVDYFGSRGWRNLPNSPWPAREGYDSSRLFLGCPN